VPVFHRNGLCVLFVHIPKAGGTFIEATFKRNGFDIEFLAHGPTKGFLNTVMRVSPQHLNWSVVQQLFDVQAFDFAFTVVRHPLERLISEYRMRVKAGQPTFDVWAQRALRQAKIDPTHFDNHIRPQVDFVGDGLTVFKLEATPSHAWATAVKTALELEDFELKDTRHANAGDNISNLKRADIQVSDTTRAMVTEFYAADFERFGYALP
jgi:hypothetical protein